jgi:hypothetical protein
LRVAKTSPGGTSTSTQYGCAREDRGVVRIEILSASTRDERRPRSDSDAENPETSGRPSRTSESAAEREETLAHQETPSNADMRTPPLELPTRQAEPETEEELRDRRRRNEI